MSSCSTTRFLPPDPAMVANSKKIAKSAIEHLGAQDLAAVVFTRNGARSQEFTRDRARLLAAVDALTTNGYNPAQSTELESSMVLSSIDAVANLARSLGSVTDRRKAVIWIGIGIPSNPWEMSSNVGLQKELYLRWVTAMDAVRRANVNIFPIDPAGLGGLGSFLNIHGLSSAPPDRAGSTAPREDLAGARVQLFRSYLQGLADNTGGRAFTSSNEFDSKIAQIWARPDRSICSDTHRRTRRRPDDSRKIQVKVNRPGVTIRNRPGYYPAGPEPARALGTSPVSPLVAALSGLLPRRDLPIRITVASLAGPDDGIGAVIVAASLKPPIPPAMGGVDVLFEALGADGKLAGSQHARATLSTRPGSTQFEAAVRLQLPVGRYQVRTAAGSEALGGSGQRVHRCRRARLPEGCLVVVRARSWATAGESPIGAWPNAPLTPITSRAFATTDDASVFARLYQGGEAPVVAAIVRTRILDESGAARLDTSETVPPERFGSGRATDVIRVLPLSRLTSGSYLLWLEAQVGRTVTRRDVRFDVK